MRHHNLDVEAKEPLLSGEKRSWRNEMTSSDDQKKIDQAEHFPSREHNHKSNPVPSANKRQQAGLGPRPIVKDEFCLKR